jgi:hypothetical protein
MSFVESITLDKETGELVVTFTEDGLDLAKRLAQKLDMTFEEFVTFCLVSELEETYIEPPTDDLE